LARAIDHAARILNWQESVLSEDMPPSWMWPFEEELEVWFDEVHRKQEEKYGGGGSSDETVPMMGNQLADAKRGKRR